MVGSWSITIRLAAAAIAVFAIMVLADCRPTTPDTEMGAESMTDTPGSAPAGQVVPTETVSVLAEPTSEPVLSLGHREGEISTMPVEPIASLPATSGSGNAVAMVKADLAQRLGVSEEEVSVKSLETMQWSDSSLGCPQPGMMYAQVITPGYRLVLVVEGQVYEAHTDEGQHAVWCEKELSAMEVSHVPGIIEPGMERLIETAREDLAERFSTAADEIEVLEAKGVVWPDASLGCPQPGMDYRQIPMDGALIRLEVEGKVYGYHSGGGRAPFLCEQQLKRQKDLPPQLDVLQLTPGSPND